jgi:SAM-dependent methyltransferase
MAQAAGAFVVGVDVNRTELQQAQRIFGCSGKLSWSLADIVSAPFAACTFDAVVVASAIQYFADLQQLFRVLSELLKPEGEIHILDSPLYTLDTLPAARERSRDYYATLGFPEMSAHYHHHSADALPAGQTEWLYLPQRVRTADHAGTDSPFPWIRLRPHHPLQRCDIQ